jgi:hypothetical protein
MPAWKAHDLTLTRPIAAPLERCAELLGVDLTAIQEAAAYVEPYLRVDGTKVWSLMQLERQLRPDAYGRVRGGYIARRRPRGHTAPVTGDEGHCSFCGATRGPFATVEGLFTVLICISCLEVRQAQPDTRLGLHDLGPYPPMTPAEMRESLELLPRWVLAQKAAANRQLIAVMRQRLAAGEQVARMYQEPGLAWLERQAETTEQLLAERQAGGQNQ